MVYQKREELEAELHISTRENCLQSPMLKKDTSGATISSTPLPSICQQQASSHLLAADRSSRNYSSYSSNGFLLGFSWTKLIFACVVEWFLFNLSPKSQDLSSLIVPLLCSTWRVSMDHGEMISPMNAYLCSPNPFTISLKG